VTQEEEEEVSSYSMTSIQPLGTIRKVGRKINLIGHILRRNCFPKKKLLKDRRKK